MQALLKVPKDKLVQIDRDKKKPAKLQMDERGCKHCPQNKTDGITKIKNKVQGKEILVFTSAPGAQENEDGKHLVGSAGQFFWDELKKVGLSRKDCDVQSAVRCFPADNNMRQRDPKKEELHACSKYTDQAIKDTKAKIYILLGGLTHKAVLGKEFKKSKRIFWSPRLNAKVYCLDHPNYFLRGQYPHIALEQFREALKSVSADLGGKKISQYSYLEERDYKAITTIADAKEFEKFIYRMARQGKSPTVDIESDEIDGKKLYLCCGFSWRPGHARSIILDHPRARKIDGKWRPLHPKVRKVLHRITQRILTNIAIKKTFHQGSSDVAFIEKYHEGSKVKGYAYDTIYAEFLAHPDRRAYGLANVALQRYPQFGNYKTVILPECIPPGTDLEAHKMHNVTDLDKLYDWAGHNGFMHFSYLPLKKLVLRNCADADITKRIELSTRKKVNKALLKVYIDAAFILQEMEPNGPDFDYVHCEKIEKLYPPKFEKVKDKLALISGRDDFNPSSSPQVHDLLYVQLKIKPPDIAFEGKKRKKNKDGEWVDPKPGTGKSVLELLGRKYEVARVIQEYRRLSKMISTYINSFKECADANDGRLRTKWWLTGTRTGRLSSGGEKGSSKKVNLQNIHGDPNLQNLATPDPNWRKVYKKLQQAAESVANQSLGKVRELVSKLQACENKEKKKSYNEALYGLIKQIQMRLYNSARWQKLVKKIAKLYGNIRVMMGFDQGQIEVRVMAQASGDKNLIRDCMGDDIHSKVGHAMTGWGVEKIKKDKKTRTLTKNIHFGILFGLSANGLMGFIKLKDPDSTITEEEAQRLYDNYFKAYPGVKAFVERMRRFVEENGYVENMFGFRRPLSVGGAVEGYEQEDTGDEESAGGAYWGNQAINTPIQGAAHQLMLMAVAVLKRMRKKYALLGVPTLEVHDAIYFKTKLKDLMTALPLCKQLLEKEPLAAVKKYWPHIKWMIPLAVEGKVGFRLGDSVDAESDGKQKKMHEMLADMFLETFVKELKLDEDLRLAA